MDEIGFAQILDIGVGFIHRTMEYKIRVANLVLLQAFVLIAALNKFGHK